MGAAPSMANARGSAHGHFLLGNRTRVFETASKKRSLRRPVIRRFEVGLAVT
jgi:hypothetical protein